MCRKKKRAQAQPEPSIEAVQQTTVMPPMGGYPGYPGTPIGVAGSCPYPVAPASQFIQLPPIVQPIVMVPFASQQQPIATFEEEGDDDYFDF